MKTINHKKLKALLRRKRLSKYPTKKFKMELKLEKIRTT